MAIGGRSSGRQQDIRFGEISNQLGRAAFNLGQMAGAAAALYGSLQVFRELEKQLILTNAIAQGTTETLRQMNDATRDFSLGVTFTASQSANALLFLSQAGFTVEQSMAAMTGVLTLAQATLEEVNETSDLIASTLKSYSLEAEEAARVSNLFAAAMNQSLATLPKISFALRQVGPVASAMGISVEDTTAALAELFNVGLRGEQAGTALRNVMVNLVSPAGDAAKLIRTLGIEIYTADGRMREFFDILQDLSRFNLSDTDLSALFGREALAGGIALLESARTNRLAEMRDSISGTQEAVRVALEQMTSFDAAMQQMRNGIDEFRISLGEQLADVIQPWIYGVTDMAIAWRELDEPTKSYITTIGLYSGALLTAVTASRVLLPIMGNLGSAVLSLSKTLWNSLGGFSDMTSALRNLRDPATSAAAGLDGVGAAAKRLGPVMLGAAGAAASIAAIGYAFYEARKAYEDAKFAEMFGEVELVASNINRRFVNLKQITSAGQGAFSSIEAFAAEFKTAQGVADQQREAAEVLMGMANNAEAVIERLNEVRQNSTLIQARSAGLDLTEFLPRLGLEEGATQTQIGNALLEDGKKLADAYVKQVREFSPALSRQLEEAFTKGFANLDISRRPAFVVRDDIIFLIEELLDEAVGSSATQRVQEKLAEQAQKLRDDADAIEANTEAHGKVYAKRLLDSGDLATTIRDAIIADVPAARQESMRAAIEASEAANDFMVDAVTVIFSNIGEGDVTAKLNKLVSDLRQKLIDEGIVDAAQLARDMEVAAARRTNVIFSETFDQMDKVLQRSGYDLSRARTKVAATSGDKEAERLLLELEANERVVNDIRTAAARFAEGLMRPIQSIENLSGSTQSELGKIISGEFVADMIEAGGQERDRALSAIQEYEDYMSLVTDRIREVTLEGQLNSLLRRIGAEIEEVDADAFLSQVTVLADVLYSANSTRTEVASALQTFATYLDQNEEVAKALVEAAGVPIDTINNMDKKELTDAAIAYLNGANLLAIINMDMRKRVSEAFLSQSTFIGGLASAGKELVNMMGEAIGAINGDGIAAAYEGAMANAEQVLESDAVTKKAADRVRRIAKNMVDASDAEFDAAINRTNNRGGGGKNKKTAEEKLAELRQFLAERNAAIVDSALELAAFGDEFDLNEIIELRIGQIDAEYAEKIASVTREYERMFRDVAKGSEDHARLLEMRDRELEQLEKLRDRNLEYANSAEYAARVQRESAQEILDKYIEMNTHTGSFFEGMVAEGRNYILQMKTEFEVGMDTMKELIDGFTSFGMNMFNDYFNYVATGQKSMSEVLRQNLAKMLMQWANYFANLAMKYMADWVLRKVLGLLGGAMGGGMAMAGGGMALPGPFPVAPTGSNDVNPFARGGIVRGTEYFGYQREENVGKRGESGAEGILPLARDSQGNMGVLALAEQGKSRGKSGSMISMTNTTNIDLGEGAESEERMQLLLERIDERNKESTLAVIAEERRVGGLLYNSGR